MSDGWSESWTGFTGNVGKVAEGPVLFRLKLNTHVLLYKSVAANYKHVLEMVLLHYYS